MFQREGCDASLARFTSVRPASLRAAWCTDLRSCPSPVVWAGGGCFSFLHSSPKPRYPLCNVRLRVRACTSVPCPLPTGCGPDGRVVRPGAPTLEALDLGTCAWLAALGLRARGARVLGFRARRGVRATGTVTRTRGATRAARMSGWMWGPTTTTTTTTFNGTIRQHLLVALWALAICGSPSGFSDWPLTLARACAVTVHTNGEGRHRGEAQTLEHICNG